MSLPHSPQSQRHISPTWSEVAHWCVWVAVVALLGISFRVWYDNRHYSWVWMSVAIDAIPEVVFLIASVFAWRGDRGMRRVGWVFIGLVALLAVVHVVRRGF